MKQKWFNVGRLGGISDGVFAIAMTLLVLDIKLPRLNDPVSSQAFGEVLVAQLPQFIAWLISFTILCRLWITQHAFLEQGEKKSRGFTTLTFVFLGTISFIPFPTSLVSEHWEQPLSVIIFSAVIAVSGLVLAGMWFTDQKMRESAGSEATGDVKHVIIAIPVISVISCLLTMADSRIGLLVWMVLPFVGIIIRRKRRTTSTGCDDQPD